LPLEGRTGRHHEPTRTIEAPRPRQQHHRRRRRPRDREQLRGRHDHRLKPGEPRNGSLHRHVGTSRGAMANGGQALPRRPGDRSL